MKKTVLISFTILCLLSTLFPTRLVPNIQRVKASETIYIRADGSIEPSTTLIISTDNVTYSFTDNINDSIEIWRSNIVLDGRGYTLTGSGGGTGVYLRNTVNVVIKDLRTEAFYYGFFLWQSENNTLSGNNVTGNDYGIWLDSSSENTISKNNITANRFGIYLNYSSSCLVSSNNVTTNDRYGIELSSSNNNTISENTITNSTFGIGLFWGSSPSNYNNILGNTISDCNHCVNIQDSSYNTISENKIASNINYGIYLEYSPNNTVFRNTITNSIIGIELDTSSDYNVILENIVASNKWGIEIYESSNNSVYRNTVANNNVSIMFAFQSSSNRIYHNNFINSSQHVSFYKYNYANIWDNGFEGNYWGNFSKHDPDNDGIVNSHYIIDTNNTDHYPLMGMFSSFNTSLGKQVEVISNSTIEDFEYFELNSTIKMHVSNVTGNQTHGFVRICIPHTLMTAPYNITIDGVNPTYWNYTLHDNSTHRWIYFAYEHSTLEIVIIPEFSSLIILPLFLIATLLAVMVYKRKHQTRNKKREV